MVILGTHRSGRGLYDQAAESEPPPNPQICQESHPASGSVGRSTSVSSFKHPLLSFLLHPREDQPHLTPTALIPSLSADFCKMSNICFSFPQKTKTTRGAQEKRNEWGLLRERAFLRRKSQRSLWGGGLLALKDGIATTVTFFSLCL